MILVEPEQRAADGAGHARDQRAVLVAVRGHPAPAGGAPRHRALAPRYGKWVIFEHCLPFDVSRSYDEAGGIAAPRIWTAERDIEMWQALQSAPPS